MTNIAANRRSVSGITIDVECSLKVISTCKLGSRRYFDRILHVSMCCSYETRGTLAQASHGLSATAGLPCFHHREDSIYVAVSAKLRCCAARDRKRFNPEWIAAVPDAYYGHTHTHGKHPCTQGSLGTTHARYIPGIRMTARDIL